MQIISPNYIVRKEGNYHVAQSLQIDVSSFGNSKEEALKNLQEAVALYYDNENCLTTEQHNLKP